MKLSKTLKTVEELIQQLESSELPDSLELIVELISLRQHTAVVNFLNIKYPPSVRVSYPPFVHQVNNKLRELELELQLPKCESLESYKIIASLENLTTEELDLITEFGLIYEILSDYKVIIEDDVNKREQLESIILLLFLIQSLIETLDDLLYDKVVLGLLELYHQLPFDFVKRLLPRLEKLDVLDYEQLERFFESANFEEQHVLYLLQSLIQEGADQCNLILFKIMRRKGFSLI